LLQCNTTHWFASGKIRNIDTRQVQNLAALCEPLALVMRFD
jgi:hypothetical protein